MYPDDVFLYKTLIEIKYLSMVFHLGEINGTNY